MEINKEKNFYQKSSEIVELVNAFEDCTLPFEKLTHETYLTVNFWYLFFNPPTEAQILICNSIRRFNFENNIRSDSYNETLAFFWIKMINFYLDRFRTKLSFLELANGVLTNFKDHDLPLRFYSREVLFSMQAKNGWIEPDLHKKSVLSATESNLFGLFTESV